MVLYNPEKTDNVYASEDFTTLHQTSYSFLPFEKLITMQIALLTFWPFLISNSISLFVTENQLPSINVQYELLPKSRRIHVRNTVSLREVINFAEL